MTAPRPSLLTDPRVRAASSEGAGIYRVVPDAVVRPASVADLVAVVRAALVSGTPLVARGAGTGMAGGNVGTGIVVDLTHLDDTAIKLDTAAGTALTAAGATFAALERAAQPSGWRLPPSPSSWRWATLGGMVATNASGARSFRHGSVRPWVLSLAMVTADGEQVVLERGRPADERVTAVRRFRSEAEPALRAAADLIGKRFPRTRKNSFGYALNAWLRSGDLLDLVIGAEGTLGIVTEVGWQLGPIPPARGGFRLAVPDDTALAAALGQLLGSGASAVELLDRTFLEFVSGVLPEEDRAIAGRAAAILLVEFEGDAGEVERWLDDWRRQLLPWTLDFRAAVGGQALNSLWEIRHAASQLLTRLTDGRRSLQVIEDGCVPPERLADYLTALRQISARHGVAATLFGHAGDGHVHVNLLPDVTQPGWERTVTDIFESVSEAQIVLGGTPSGEHGAGRLRAGLLERVYGREIVDLFRLVKRAFDPTGIMNPGVILAGANRESPVTSGPIADLKVGADAVEIPADIAEALRDIEQKGRWDRDRLALADCRSPVLTADC
jgi:FAD/FMN-containing dehydrogenase